MENYIIDIDHNEDLKNITAEKTDAAVSGDIRVTIRPGVTTAEAHKALQAISSALIGDQIKLD